MAKFTVTVEARGRTYTETFDFPNWNLVFDTKYPDDEYAVLVGARVRDWARARLDKVFDRATKHEVELAEAREARREQ